MPELVGRHPRLCFALLMGMLAVLLLQSHRQFLAGDEPRYLIYAVSFIRHGSYAMTVSEWSRLSMRVVGSRSAALPTGAGGAFLMNGVYVPTLLSPVAGMFSLAGLRLATLLAGIGGLFCLHRLLGRIGRPMPALGSLAVAAFSVPLLPYLHLFYMETFLFALVCWGWERLQTQTRGAGGDLLTALVIVSIPFAHMRGSVVAALLLAGLLASVARRRLWTRAAAVCAVGLLAATALVLLNRAIYGAVTGPVNSARPPVPWQWFPVLSMQLFNVRHGLLAYAPVWVLGYAGLWAGAWSGGRPGLTLPRQALILAAAAALTGVGVNPGECWPARFWVLSVPMLSVGLCVWIGHARGTASRICLVILLAVTLGNTVLFFRDPNAFLENRQTSTTYEAFFNRFGVLDPNVLLPVENDDAANRTAAEELALGAGAMVLLMALALRHRAAALPALLLLLAVADLSHVRRLHGAQVTASRDHLRIVLARPVRVVTVEIGHAEQTWFVPPASDRFRIGMTGQQGRIVQTRAADQTLTAACRSGLSAIDIAGNGVDLQAQSQYRLKLLASRSLLRSTFTGGAC